MNLSNLLLPTLACAALVSCGQVAHTPRTSTADADFAALSKRWMDGWMELNAVAATHLGDHRFDSGLDDLSAGGRAKATAFSRGILGELDAIDNQRLGRENQVDALILHNQVEGDLWSLESLQDWAWDPQLYNNLAGGAIYTLMAREYAPLPQRLKAAAARMAAIPTLYTQMRANLDPARVPRVHAETVARQNGGILDLIDQFITPNAGQLSGKDRQQLDAAVTQLRAAVAAQQTWLDQQLVPNAKGDFRLGRKLYDEKLKLALNSSLSRAEIRQRAEAEMQRVRTDMYQIAAGVLKSRHSALPLPLQADAAQQQRAIETALEFAYSDRPARDQVVEFAKQTLADATKFTREHNLVTVPDDPVKIIIMPKFQQGVSVAYCDSPGPLDKGQDTYFAISPIPADWKQAQVDSFLREYNSRQIHLLSIHEAMPGHYLEGAISGRNPSILRGVLRSGLFAEGWAVYTERMMTEAGYRQDDPLYKLVQLKFYLRSVSNAILDQGVHVDGWSKAQAMELMTHQAFQQQSEAEGKWRRAQLTSAQLPTYFVGVQEQLDMRAAAQARWGQDFTLRRYHDAVLSHGAPPVRFVRELLLDEPVR
jgi:uncharacterized protein (DUF885 family)